MHVSEYICSSCRRNFEVLESPGYCTSRPGCPHCGGRDLMLGGKKNPGSEGEPENEGDEEADEGEEEDVEEDENDEFPGSSELN